jgi:hypothetical protein
LTALPPQLLSGAQQEAQKMNPFITEKALLERWPVITHDVLVDMVFDGKLKVYGPKADGAPLTIPRKTKEQKEAETRGYKECPAVKIWGNLKPSRDVLDWLVNYPPEAVAGDDEGYGCDRCVYFDLESKDKDRTCLDAVASLYCTSEPWNKDDFKFSERVPYLISDFISAIANKKVNHEVRHSMLSKILPTLFFRRAEIDALEAKQALTSEATIPQRQQQTSNIKDPETFIRALEVSYVSDTEIRISGGGKKSKTYEMKELGFKRANSIIWKEFSEIVRRPDHTYHVGKAHGAKRARKASYDVSQKRLLGINDKLLSFFNKNYQAQLPNKFRVYELIPEKREAPGTYRFKFQIVDASQVAKKNYENLSKEELIHEIETLSSELVNLSNRGDEDSEEKINEIQNILYPAMKVALNKGWLTRNRAAGYLNPSEEYISQTDQRVKRKKHSDLIDIFSGDENQED